MLSLKHFHRGWFGALCLFIAALTTALADPGPLAQAPILTSAASAPNILIVVDDSGSMGWRRSGQPKRPMQQAQDAAISLLDSLSNVRVGVASFSRYNFGGELDQPVVDLDTNRRLSTRRFVTLLPGAARWSVHCSTWAVIWWVLAARSTQATVHHRAAPPMASFAEISSCIPTTRRGRIHYEVCQAA